MEMQKEFVSEERKNGKVESMGSDGSGSIVGVILVILGIVFLASNIFTFSLGGLVFAAGFVGAGAVFYTAYRKNPKNWGLQIPAYVMVGIGALIVAGTLGIGGNLIGAGIMFGIGFPFLYTYSKNQEHWWALIPAYVMAAIGVLILLSGFIEETLIAAYVMYAIAAPFLYVYTRNRNNWWALIPGGIMAAIGTAFVFGALARFLPVVMILVGVYLLTRKVSANAAEKNDKGKPAFQPISGPAADKPSE